MRTLGERIAHALKESGYSPKAAAEKIGCTREAILQWRSGDTKNLKNEFLFAFADLTKFEARWIATGQGPRRKAELERLLADPAVAKVAVAMQTMAEYRRADLVKISEAMAAPPDDLKIAS